MDDKSFLPTNIPSDFPKSELVKALLLYNPRHHEDGIPMERARSATGFFTFLGPFPEAKPWIEEWLSEVDAVRKEAAAELGQAVVDQLRLSSHSLFQAAQEERIVQKIAYW
jgi:hypothetical protein